MAIGVLTLLATFVRVWRLTAVGFGGDESVYAGQAALLAHVDGVGRWFIPASRGNSNFLLSQWLVSLAYRMFGVSDLAARLFTAITSILTVVLVYLIARQLYGRQRDAIAAGLIMAISGYAIMLGRLALLDAPACLFITLAMYFLAKWSKSGRLLWLGSFVVAAAAAIQVKVTSALIVPVAIVVIAVTGDWRRLTVRRVVGMLLLGLAALSPALVQLIGNSGGLRSYFNASTARSSGVPWYYYFGIVWSAEGALLSAVLIFGIVVALVRHKRADALPLVWFAMFAVVLQLYPLKGFNYALPIIPPLALVAGHAIGWVTSRVRRGRLVTPRAVMATVIVALLASQVLPVKSAITNDRSAGMREAAYWLKAHGAQRAGTMALSHGSGQYVLSFYGGIDSYPYGRFRIATVIPGGHVVNTTARRDGGVPLDWVDYWPARLIAQDRVSYLVYQTRPLDDPPEQSQVAGTVTEKQFRSFIAAFGGHLVHTVYFNHEARVYVYRVTKRLAKPIVTAAVTTHIGNPVVASASTGARIVVKAKGFVINSPLTVSYHGRTVGHSTADSSGSATIDVKVPSLGQAQYHLIVTDARGNSASVTGVSPTRLVYSVDNGIVRVFGVGYTPANAVVFSYENKPIGVSYSRADGSVSWSFPLPVNTHPRFRLAAVDQQGRAASATGLAAPFLAFVARGQSAEVSGRNYFPHGKVTIVYATHVVGSARTDSAGKFKFAFTLPSGARPGYRLVATDFIGRHATITGLVRR